MTKLPTKVRIDIRDLWDAPGSAVEKTLNSLYETLGHKITPEVEWPALWAVLTDRFPNKEGFVPAIVATSIAWYERLMARLANTVYSSWTEQLLDMLSEVSKTRKPKLHIQATGSGRTTRPTTHWDSTSSSFILNIPDTPPISLEAMTSGFDKDFENFFADNPMVKEDEWAHVDDQALDTISVQSVHPAVGTDRLPMLDMLLRPDELFKTTTPYILTLEVKTTEVIVVQGSHQASLELLASYLQKWAKVNFGKPAMNVELHDSDYCFGVRDSLTITPRNAHRPANPTIVLAFIEGVLGYQLVHTTGYHWVYRSEKAFR